MAFTDFPSPKPSVALLQRSLARARLGHAYLFTGHDLPALETMARTLAKTLNCRQPVCDSAGGPATDCCDQCANCRKIDAEAHPDLHWVRAESKSRIISVDQMREVMREIFLKPNEAEYKVAVIVAADRMNPQAANAFLKTLEEPPPKSILILLTTEPQRLLETILSRCLRLNFAGGDRKPAPELMAWLAGFVEAAAADEKSLLGRYRLLDALLVRLGALREEIETALQARSPLERHEEAEAELVTRWERELAAAVEAEYRLRRLDFLAAVQSWLRDVWLRTMAMDPGLLNFPELAGTGKVAQRLTARQAMDNLGVMERTQRLLGSNVQEALALEVGLLKLNL